MVYGLIMSDQSMPNMKAGYVPNNADDRTRTIIVWLNKIEKSELSLTKFFAKYPVPFSRSQYYLYSQKLRRFGESGLQDKRSEGGNRKVTAETEAFIVGCVESNPEISPKWLQEAVNKRFGLILTPSGVTRVLQRLYPDKEKRTRGRPKKQHEAEILHNSCGGFELIVALAYHLGWPQMTADAIKDAVESLRRTKAFRSSDSYFDKKDRDKLGRFTTQYNQREDIRKTRFESITEKRRQKNWKSMNVVRDGIKTIQRKSIAILSLPVVTMNGGIRTVDSALGQELKHFAGFDYRQSSVTKYLNELKYLGVSGRLLDNMVTFWSKCWGSEMKDLSHRSFLCYYIDGNTKALWSSKRVKKNKVTMLGRVMGCLEHVFIHDTFGRPVYFETYSGHGPCGERILEMFEKIEGAIEQVPGSRTSVTRVLVMDGASNSVRTLRAFASQQKYHYITPLNDNQWKERKIYSIGRPTRYRYGKATLREIVIELEDSQDKGYLVRTGGIKINWDNGKTTVLLTSLPVQTTGTSEIVRAYFNRWPSQELQFKGMKSATSLHRVAGYGKQEIKDERVVERQAHATMMINKLKEILKHPLEDIRIHEESIAKLIPKERRLRKQSDIYHGKRRLPEELMDQLNSYGKKILSHEREIKKIEKRHLDHFRLLRKHRREWLRLQGKETVYKVDVELDQIVTFHRVSLAHLYAYFIKHFLGGDLISMTNLLHKVIHIHASIKETADARKIILDYNKKDTLMMQKLSGAIKKMNSLNVIGPQGKRMEFFLGNRLS
jgi:transposase